jgi:hypothetical protein
MATDERLFDLFRQLDRPLAPDPAFAHRLYGVLRVEAGFAPATRPSGRRWLPRFPVGNLGRRPLVLTPRLLLLAVLALLLAACVAAAYIVLQGWLSTGPRGLQFSDDFTFTEVYREGGAPIEPGPVSVGLHYPEFALSPDGSALYAVRIPRYPDHMASIVRLTGLAGEQLAREEVLDLATLSEPALWDAGLDPSTVDIGLAPSNDDRLSVGPGGDLFIALGAYGRERERLPDADQAEQELRANWPDITDEELERVTTRQPLVAASIVVVRPDGARQRILTVAELQAAGLVPAGQGDVSISAVASSADRLWLRSDLFGSQGNATFLFEVLDPNRDGDWSDRSVLPLVLPDEMPSLAGLPRPGDEGRELWLAQGLAGEVSGGQVDRSRSILLPMLGTTGEYRIYRLTDAGDDGDLRGGDQVELVFSSQPGFGDMPGPHLASRVVVDGGEEVLRELLVSGITGPSRIARVSADGSVTDIARALPFGPQDIEAAPNGDILVVVQESGMGDRGPSYVVYRLAPVPAGQPMTPTASPAEPSPSASPTAGAPGTLTPGEPRIAYSIEAFSDETARIMVVGADGSGPSELIPGEHNSYFCQSADGRLVGFWSDEDVPHESFLYVADADGTDRRKISEDVGIFWCGFSSRYILIKGRSDTAPIIRHDLETSEETELLTGADPNRMQADPTGRRYLFVSGVRPGSNPPSGAETLELIDIESGERRALHGPLPEDRMFGALTWSPDGQLVTYASGSRPSQTDVNPVGPIEVYVQESAGGDARLVLAFEGRVPCLRISGDARYLLVCPPSPDAPGPISLVDLASGAARSIADEATWAGWHPDDPTRFAYATKDRLFLDSVDGESRELARAPAEGICPDCETSGAPAGEWGWGNWMGWSPDGRYIGLPDFAPVIAVIDVETGELAILTGDVGEEALVSGGRWLR